MNNLSALDNYNILDLLSLSDISDDRKDKLLANLNNYIWEEFIFIRLDKLLTTGQLKQVKEMDKKGEAGSKILEFINSKVPNFNQLYLEYEREAKLRIIQDQIKDVLRDIDNQLEFRSKDVQQILSAKKEKFQKARQLVEEENWEELKRVMSVPG